jgi:hypothetical protein
MGYKGKRSTDLSFSYRLLKQQKEEERLAKEAQRKAEEEAQRLERERKDEIERQKRETERQRKEEERQRKDEERLRKEEDKRRRQREEKERRRKEKEEQQRQKQEQQRKEEAERQQQQLLEKQRREEIELERQRLALEAATLSKETTTEAASQLDSSAPLDEPPSRTTVTPVTDSGVPDETRQRVLMNALLGSSSSLVSPHQDGAARDEQRRSTHAMSFAPSHLNTLQAGLPTSVPPGKYIDRGRRKSSLINVESTSVVGAGLPLLSMSPVMPSLTNQHIPGNVGTSMFSPLDNLSGHLNKTPRPIVPSVGAIGQPVHSERRSFSSTSLAEAIGHHPEDQSTATSPSLLKRRSTPGDIGPAPGAQSTGMDNSFFSNFLFGDANRSSSVKDHNLFNQHQQQQQLPFHTDSRPAAMDTTSIDRRLNDIRTNWTNGKEKKKQTQE